MLTTIISGGQTGADQAGLRAAKALGLRTGGWAPRGWRTLDGPAPWLGSEFGLVEASTDDYPTRTKLNVYGAQATVRFAVNFNSPGERCTLSAITKYKKSYLDVALTRFEYTTGFDLLLSTAQLATGSWASPELVLQDFLRRHRVVTLNIAGNAEKTAPGIGRAVEGFLMRALRGWLPVAGEV